MYFSLIVCTRATVCVFAPEDISPFLPPQSCAKPGDSQAAPDPILFFTVAKLIKCNCILTNTNYQTLPPQIENIAAAVLF